MAELRQNTWTLDQWYDQDVAGNVSYSSDTYQLWGWGKDGSGQLGQNSTSVPAYSSPVQIGTESTWKTIGVAAIQNNMTMATKTDGTLWVWGWNLAGQLGLNQEGHAPGARSSPTQIPGTWGDALFTGTGWTHATKADGTLWAWGNGYGDGYTAQNNRVRYSSPVQIGSATDWGTTRGKLSGALAIKTNGELWGWGQDAYGKLAQNISTGLSYSSPIQIPGTTWSTLRAYVYAFAAVKTDGTLWVAGYNQYGKFGQNNTTNYSSPIQIPGTWKDLNGGGMRDFSGFINTDNELWMMGHNNYGFLGQNDTTTYSSPIQVPGSWDQIGFSHYTTMGIKTDGTSWVWGRTSGADGAGVLGLNAGVDYSSPVQLPGTDWDQPTGARSQMFALLKN